jgi:uncharacterized membrane protein
MRTNVGNWERALSISAGVALIAAATRSRRLRSSLGTTGIGLLARGLTGLCPVNAARGIRVEDHIVIARRPEEVFEFWRDLTNLPRFMPHLERVDVLDGRRSHWVARGPAGVPVEWDAEVINEIRPNLIAWQSLPGSTVASAGSVRFKPTASGMTELDVVFQYEPPAGKLGAAVARLLGDAPETTLRQDLRRMKQLLEAA